MNLQRVRRFLLALGAGLLACAALAQPIGLARESAVKAAYLLQFGSFVEWPPGTFRSTVEPVVIGIFGDEAVASELEQIARGRDIEGRPVAVQRVRDADGPRLPHILYAGGTRVGRVRELLRAMDGPVLTVADVAIDQRTGPVLHFVMEEGRVRFHASLAAAAARNLKLSARLLAVAQQVEGR